MTFKEKNKKQQTIKEAARKLFNQFGFHKTSLDDIARRCGMAKQSIYYYYPNKEAIFNEIVLEYAQQILRNVEKSLNSNLQTDQKFIQFSRLVYENLKSLAKQIGKAPIGFIEYSPHGRPVVEKIRQLFKEKLKAILAEGIKQGVFYIEDTELTLNTIMEMANFIRIRWLINHDEEQCDKIVEEMNRIVLNGLIARKD